MGRVLEKTYMHATKTGLMIYVACISIFIRRTTPKEALSRVTTSHYGAQQDNASIKEQQRFQTTRIKYINTSFLPSMGKNVQRFEFCRCPTLFLTPSCYKRNLFRNVSTESVNRPAPFCCQNASFCAMQILNPLSVAHRSPSTQSKSLYRKNPNLSQ